MNNFFSNSLVVVFALIQFFTGLQNASAQSRIAAPIVSSPINGSVLSSAATSATFSWAPVTGASGYLVRVENLTDKTLRDPRNTYNGGIYLYIDNYKSTSISVPVKLGYSYNFWVHSITPNFKYADLSSWSPESRVATSVGTITTLPPQPQSRIAAPIVSSPISGTVLPGATTSTTFSWSPVAGASGYLVRAADLKDNSLRDSRNTYNGASYLYIDNYKSTSISVPVKPGHSYNFWVHSITPTFKYADLNSWSLESRVAASVGTGVTDPLQCIGSTSQSCSIANGSGSQSRTCNNGVFSAFSSCQVASCNSGYQVSANSCVAIAPVTCTGPTSQSCSVANGVGSQSRTCNNGVFSAFSACSASTCNAQYTLIGGVCVSEDSPMSGPLKKNPLNSRYFTDNSGRGIYLTGPHTWETMFMTQSMTFFENYLQLLKQTNNNFIRVWSMSVDDGGGTTYAMPWKRTGPGTGIHGKLKIDFNQLDQVYFDRLKERVRRAQEEGIYIGMMLFDGWNLWARDDGDYWPNNPFNRSNNINGINGDSNNDGYGTEIHTTGIPAVLAIQKKYIEKLVDTLNDFDNVIYEIANEDGTGSSAFEWQVAMLEHVKTYQANKPKKHLVGISCIYSSTSGSNVNSSIKSNNADQNKNPDWISLCGAANSGHNMTDNPPAVPGSKPNFSDTDHIWGSNPGSSPAWAWKIFTRGYHPIYMDPDDNTRSNSTIKAMGLTLNYASKMNLNAMTPQTDTCNTGYCLANPGQEYLVFNASNNSSTTTIKGLSAGSYTYEWMDASSGVKSSSYTYTSTATADFSPTQGKPSASHVLYVKRISSSGGGSTSSTSSSSSPPACTGSTSQSCSVPNGLGSQIRTCNNGSWSNFSSCAVLSCSIGYSLNNGVCVANAPATCTGSATQSCSVTNGVGSQSRTCSNGVFSAFSSCQVASCNSGHSLSAGACVADAPTVPGQTGSCDKITRLAITWTFDKAYPCGTYANGDHYVVAPNGIKIKDISPKSILSGDRTINGSTINPESSDWPKHGFDSLMAGKADSYRENLNAGRPGGKEISASNPANVAAGSSFVSAVSHPSATNRPTLTDISILTVVASAPAEGSFRPPYSGNDKKSYWNKNKLDYSILQNVTLSGGASLTAAEANFERPWFELGTESDGRYYHPANHQPEYGRDMAWKIGDAMLALHLNNSNALKEKLYIRLVQWGIDLYGCAKTGAVWADNGGHNAGRKGALVLAAVALNDPDIRYYADGTRNKIFAEDRQTFYVTQSDVGRGLYQGDGRAREQYISSDVGIAEWGEKHTSQPDRDGRNWGAYYRDTNYIAHLGEALAVRMLKGGKAAWNWPAFFDYTDRSWSVSSSSMRPFPAAMWRQYRQAN